MSSSTIVRSFNSLLAEFIGDLSSTFDEYPELQKASDTLSALLQVDDKIETPLNTFYEIFGDHSDLIMSKDKSLFEKCKIPFAESFDLKKAYNDSDDDTHEAIWGYLQQLFVSSTTFKTMTPQLLGSIESVAEACMSQIRDGSLTKEQAQNPLYIFQQLQENPEIMKAIQDAQN